MDTVNKEGDESHPVSSPKDNAVNILISFLPVFFLGPCCFKKTKITFLSGAAGWEGRRGAVWWLFSGAGETWQPVSPAVVVATPEAALAIPDLPFS